MALSLQTLLPAVARFTDRAGLAHLSDGELLGRFTTDGDTAAFEALVKRHGGMVLGVCGRVLGRGGDADDAFQATFLALARRARSIRSESVAGWLYRVARRASVRAAQRRTERTTRERRAARPEAVVSDEVERADWRALLDREVERLPVRFREAFVLCHLEERPHEDAARELGCPLGTLHSRLARAKERLRERIGVVPLALGGVVSASQVRAAVRFAGGSIAVPSAVVALSQGMWSTMTMFPIKSVAAVLLATAAAGAGVMAYKPATATATPTQVSPPRGEPTLDELRRENEQLRREVGELKQKLAGFEGRMTVIGDAPTDAEVLRSLPKTVASVLGTVTTSPDDIKIVKNKIVDRLDPPREFPLVGKAQLRHMNWECSVYFLERVQLDFPFPLVVTKPRVQVMYIDKDALIFGAK